jgi:Co/Zn/Cd efflux system component
LAEVLNLGYFGVEFVMARVIGSVSLFADSIERADPDRVLRT